MSNNNNTTNSGVSGTQNKRKIINQSGGGSEGPGVQNPIPANTSIQMEPGGKSNAGQVNNGQIEGTIQQPSQVQAPPPQAKPVATVTSGQQAQQQLLKGPEGQQGQDQEGPVDFENVISESETEVKGIDQKQTEKQKKLEKLTKAIESLNSTERLVFTNNETGEFIGTKFKYTADADGKTVYDYMNDEDVKAHIKFVVPEGQSEEGGDGFLEKKISFYWTNPIY